MATTLVQHHNPIDDIVCIFKTQEKSVLSVNFPGIHHPSIRYRNLVHCTPKLPIFTRPLSMSLTPILLSSAIRNHFNDLVQLLTHALDSLFSISSSRYLELQ